MIKRVKLQYPLSLVYIVFFGSLIGSCSSSKNLNRDFVYFREGADTVASAQKEMVIRPNDLLSIQVYSKTLNQEQAAIFNIPSGATNQVQGYQVNMAGNLEIPLIGSVKAAGLTKDQLQLLLVQKLTDFVKNVSVIIRFLQFHVNVLGEVKAPGTQKFQGDRVTIIDAISAAGDLTDHGKREDVTVIREQNGKRIYHTIDLRSRNLFESPVYTMQPNDIVYVSPNKNKLKTLSVNPESQRKTGLIISITSVILGIATLIITASR